MDGVPACVRCVQAKATAAERRASETESEMLLMGRSLRDAEAAVVEWQVRVQVAGGWWHAPH